MASSGYVMDNKATYDSASPIEVVPREESRPYSTLFASDEHIPKAGIYDETESGYPKQSRSLASRRESEDDHNQGFEQHAADARTPLVRDLNDKKGWKKGWSKIHDMEYEDPEHQRGPMEADNRTPLKRFLNSMQTPMEQRIEDKRNGVGRQKHPFVVYILTAIMISVFIYELVFNGRAQGSPISLKPSVNPMLGPSSSALISLGARFPPCMKYIEQVPPSTLLACPNNTANPVTETCTLEQLCAFNGFQNGIPKQWFRFITPIFLHAGFIHLLLNMIAQWILSGQVERDMGSVGFFLTYFAAGIFGNVLGGNFALVGIPSVGASGAIFGTLAVTWVDLFAHWRYHYRPVTKLIFMTIELGIGVAIGFIPYIDNFAHLGGFLMGLLVGTIFYPIISPTLRPRLIMLGFRLAALPLAIVLYVVLIRNFYTSDPYSACSWCRYLSCIPIALNNYCKGTGLTTTTT